MADQSRRPQLATNTIEWRRERADALSATQRKRADARTCSAPLELRDADDDGVRVLRSYASLFNTPYTIGSGGYRFQEIVHPGAFKRSLGSNPDVVFRTEHSGPPLAATWNDTLRLGEDDVGFWYEADLNPRDQDAQSLIAKVERRDYRESSFAFRVPNGGDEWNDDRSQRDLIHCEIDRGDVSVVTFGASAATGKHMVLRSEDLAALQAVGFEGFLAAWTEWRDFTLLSVEERAGRIISSASMDTLKRVLSLVSDADDAVDEAQPLLADLMGVPNPDADDEEDEDGDGRSSRRVRQWERRKDDSDVDPGQPFARATVIWSTAEQRETFSDLMTAANQALVASDDCSGYVQDMDEDNVYYYDWNSGCTKSCPYSVQTGGAMTLGTPTNVRPVTSYVPSDRAGAVALAGNDTDELLFDLERNRMGLGR